MGLNLSVSVYSLVSVCTSSCIWFFLLIIAFFFFKDLAWLSLQDGAFLSGEMYPAEWPFGSYFWGSLVLAKGTGVCGGTNGCKTRATGILFTW